MKKEPHSKSSNTNWEFLLAWLEGELNYQTSSERSVRSWNEIIPDWLVEETCSDVMLHCPSAKYLYRSSIPAAAAVVPVEAGEFEPVFLPGPEETFTIAGLRSRSSSRKPRRNS